MELKAALKQVLAWATSPLGKNQVADKHRRGFKALAVGSHQQDRLPGTDGDHLGRLRRCDCQRLFAQYVTVRQRRILLFPQMLARRRGDIDRLHLVIRQAFVQAVVGGRYVMLRGQATGLFDIPADQGNQSGSLHAAERRQDGCRCQGTQPNYSEAYRRQGLTLTVSA